MAQQYTDRAYEVCTVSGLNDVVLGGSILGYQDIPTGDSVCVIQGYTGSTLNGEWEVVRGVRTGSTFTRDTVIDSSNAGAKVNFTGDTEIALVADSETFEDIINDIATNAANISANAANIAINAGNITGNANDITTNAGNIAINAGNISTNTGNISTNAGDISTLQGEMSTAQADILDKVDKTVTTLQTMVGELNLPDATLAALDEIANANTIYDVALYLPIVDDDDNGAWIDKSGSQSYCQETLNTATRGSTKKFPKGGVLGVVEFNKVTLYDISSSDLPMWMVFNATGYGTGHLQNQGTGFTSISFKNGRMYVGSEGGALQEVRFIDDLTWLYTSSSMWGGSSATPIEQRNTLDFYDLGTGVGLPKIVDSAVNQTAISSDGDGNNIVYVATDSGLSRIATDYTVSDWTDDGNIVNVVDNVAVDDDYVYWSTDSSGAQKRQLMWPLNIVLEDTRYYDAKVERFATDPDVAWNTHTINLSYNDVKESLRNINAKGAGGAIGLHLLYPNYNDGGNAMTATINDEFNSGIMQGDIRGAWLANTSNLDTLGIDETTNVKPDDSAQSGVITDITTPWYSNENSGKMSIASSVISFNGLLGWELCRIKYLSLLIHDSFSIEVTMTNYVVGNLFVYIGGSHIGTISANGTYTVYGQARTGDTFFQFAGALSADYDFEVTKITRTGNAITNGDFDIGITGWTDASEAGASISWNAAGYLSLNSDGANRAYARQTFSTVAGERYVIAVDVQLGSLNLGIGGNAYGSDILAASLATGTHVYTFTAVGTTTYIQFNVLVIGSKNIDSVSVRLAVDDRSYQNQGLEVHGEIEKSLVSSGSELVWFDGWESGNYLLQANNSKLNFNTGDFTIYGWFIAKSTVTSDFIVDRYNGGGESRFAVYIDSNNNLVLNTYDGITTTYISNLEYKFNVPTFFMVRRLSSDRCVIMINDQIETIAGTSRDVDSIASLKVGVRYNLANAFDGGIALLRIGAGAPTDEQALLIYEQEKRLFNENTKCTLQDVVNDVVAIDHDEDIDVLSACTANSVTRFNGLVVVDDWAEIASSISTKSEKVSTGN